MKRKEFFWETIARLEDENEQLRGLIFRQLNHLHPCSPEDIHLLKRIVEGPRASEAA